MTWQDTLLEECYKTLEKGGEVRIQFSIRNKEGNKTAIPIIRSYPKNQIVCPEVKLEKRNK